MKTNPNHLVSAYGYANEQSHFDSSGGLTKREYFAAMAMQGLLANTSHDNSYEEMADKAVLMADTIIEQLNKTEK